MKILIVSSYPPTPCGIAAYAEQQVEALRREGHVIDVFTWDEGDGDFCETLCGGANVRKLAKIAWAYERIYIHYTPGFFYRLHEPSTIAKTRRAFFSLMLLFGSRIHFIVHETDYNVSEPEKAKPVAFLESAIWKRAGRIVFHSEAERRVFANRFGFAENDERLELTDQGRHYVSRCSLTREAAREQFGIPNDKTLFLCIGFVQPHKGYDRVIRALTKIESPDAWLRVVGSVRIAWQPALDYAKQLHAMAAGDPRCEFVEEFVSPEAFDAWIVACDYVVIPYREIWSSAVAARAVLHERPVIAAEVGGLRDQLPAGTRFFTSDEELIANMEEIMSPVASA